MANCLMAHFEGATMEKLKCDAARFDNALFYGATLYGLEATGARFLYSKFAAARISGNFAAANFSGATFHGEQRSGRVVQLLIKGVTERLAFSAVEETSGFAAVVVRSDEKTTTLSLRGAQIHEWSSHPVSLPVLVAVTPPDVMKANVEFLPRWSAVDDLPIVKTAQGTGIGPFPAALANRLKMHFGAQRVIEHQFTAAFGGAGDEPLTAFVPPAAGSKPFSTAMAASFHYSAEQVKRALAEGTPKSTADRLIAEIAKCPGASEEAAPVTEMSLEAQLSEALREPDQRSASPPKAAPPPDK
jgi:hypothetical protein